MVAWFNKLRQSVALGAVASAPLVLASGCTESGSSFFDPPEGGSGKGGSSTGGSSGASAGTTASGGTGGGETGGTSSGGSSSGGSSSGGTTASGGTPGGGSGGDGAVAGTGGSDPSTGGTGGTDATAGEGGMGEGGMSGTGGSTGGAGTGGVGGTSATGGDAGTSGTSAGGTAGTAGDGAGGMSGTAGTSSGGTGGASCTPATEICDGIDNDCDKDEDEDGACPSGCHGRIFEGETYLLCTSDSELSWAEARDLCMEADDGSGNTEVAGPMTLVEVDSPEENAFLVGWIKEEGITDGVWHGANDRDDEGEWVWDRGDEEPVRFYTVTATMRMPVNGAYHDWPPMEPTYNGTTGASVGDCGTFDADRDFRWDDRACTQSAYQLSAFICGEIP